MKQKIAKRIMAFVLTASLVFPGSYVNALAEDGGSVGGSTGEASEELVIRNPGNPGNVLNAYIGQPFSFYVRAEGATSYEVDLGEELGAADRTNKPTLDAASGKFTWAPAAADEGKSYTVTLTAKRGTESVSREVEIFAGYANKVYGTEFLPVVEDAHVETYNAGDREKSYNEKFLSVMLGNLGDTTMENRGTLNNGKMGEKKPLKNGVELDWTKSDQFEYKASLMKFDLAEWSAYEEHRSGLEIADASLLVTYISRRDGAYGNPAPGSGEFQKERLRVVKAPSNDWSENTSAGNRLTWRKWIEMNEGITYGDGDGEKPIKYSEEYLLKVNQTLGSNSYPVTATVDGTKVKTDVKDFIAETLMEQKDESGHRYMSLAMTDDAGTQHFFVSKEGADYFEQAKAIEHAAPTIQINYTYHRPDGIEGAESLYLAKGYAATETDSFAVTGMTEPAPILMAEDSNTAGGKITWNEEGQRFEIAAGIAPGVYPLSLETTINSQKVTKDFTLYVTGSLLAPKFTNPAKGADGTAVVSAYAGMPVSFTVKAEMDAVGESVERIFLDPVQLEALGDASFDASTGEFTWTPSADGLGTEDSRDYPITFTAYGSNGVPAEHRVVIRVGRSVSMSEDPDYLTVANDGFTKSWSYEKSEANEGVRLLWVSRDRNDAGNLSSFGKLGEKGTPNDTKMGFLQFDLESLRNKEFDAADLMLTYICSSAGTAPKTETICLQVAAVPNFSWPSPLTWNGWDSWKSNPDNGFEDGAKEVKSSWTYTIANAPISGHASALNKDFSNIKGDKIRTDITSYVKEAIERGESKLTLIFNSDKTDACALFFVSKEGAVGDDAYANPNNVDLVAPSIVLKSYADDAEIEGPDGITLTEGYAETYTDSFTVPSYELGDPQITPVSPDADKAHLENFEWDHDNSRIKIKAGLDAGGQESASYPVKLSHKGFEKTFTVTVNANKKTDLQKVKVDFKALVTDDINTYTSESTATYRYILGALEKALEADAVSAATLKSAEDLVKTFDKTTLVKLDADYLAAQIKPYKDGVYTAKVYTTATWDPYKAALDEAEALSNYTEAQLTAAIKKLKEAHGKLAVNGGENGSEEGKLYELLQQANEMLENADIYNENDITNLQEKFNKADEELQNETPSNVATLATELKAAMNIQINPKKKLEVEITNATKDVGSESNYTASSWTAYQEALTAARGHANDASLTVDQINDVIIPQLTAAVSKLVTLEEYRTSEIARVTDGVDNDANYYVPADWTAYETALAAVTGLSGSDLTEANIRTKIDELSAKVTALNENKKETKTKEELKTLIDSITKSDYTSASWTAQNMDALMAAANEAYSKADATVREISAAWDALNTAKGQLEEAGPTYTFAQLTTLLRDAVELKEEDYEPGTWSDFAEALAAAQGIKRTDSSEQISAAYIALYNAKEALLPASGDKTKEELDELVQGVKDQINGADGAEKIDPSDYTEEDYKKLTDAIEAAEKLNENSTQEEINAAYAAIEDALAMAKISSDDVAALVEKVKGMNLKESDWDAASYKALLDAIAEAEKTASGADGAKTAKEAYNALKAAYGALKKATPGGGVVPDPSALTVGATVSDDKDAAPAGSKAEYTVVDAQARTVILKKGKDEATVNVPAAISVGGKDCTVIGIGDKAFISTKKLKKLTIADTVTSIGKQAFSGAKKLSSVKIGTGVTSIGAKAFFNCKKLSKLEIRAKGLKTVKSNAFKGTKKNIRVTLKGIKGKQKTKIKNLLLKKGKMSKGAKIK